MEHPIKINKRLLWDYQLSEKDLEREEVFVFYLSRLLDNGNFDDTKVIPLELIKKYLEKLHLSRKVREFWEWYLGKTERLFWQESKMVDEKIRILV